MCMKNICTVFDTIQDSSCPVRILEYMPQNRVRRTAVFQRGNKISS